MLIKISGGDSLARCQRGSAEYGWLQVTLGRSPGGGFRDVLFDGITQPVALVGVWTLGRIGKSAGGIPMVILQINEDLLLGSSDPELVGAAVGEMFSTRERALGLI